ncbi:MAG TPA: GMC family oxidoreductase [Candidatus Angelobacter sp.]|nr:GMC family oxidoreductase [Candidatus Angelobacter sp.]
MIKDADRDVRPDEELKADICIIGSGAAGISMAHRLLGSGKRIIVLESSQVNIRRFSFADQAAGFALSESPQIAEDNHRFTDPTVQPLYNGEVLNPRMRAIDPRFPIRSRIRCYGGTTNCWGGWTRSLSPIDFDRSDLDPKFVWPIHPDALDPYYKLAIVKYCSLGNWNAADYDNASYWVDKTIQSIAPFQFGPNSSLRTAVFSVMNGRGPGEDGALDFQLVWGKAIEPESVRDVIIYRNANARFIDWSGAKVDRIRATTVRKGVKGHDFTVKATRYVLAMGGIEIPRLLLVSKAGNSSGQVGANFMIHPVNERAATYSVLKAPDARVLNFYHYPGGTIRGEAFPPTVFATFSPTDAALKREHIGNFRALMNFRSGEVNFNWEQVPNPKSKIILGGPGPIFEDPGIKVDWNLTQLDYDTINKGLKMVGEELTALGYARNFQPTYRTDENSITNPGDHHMGATRMSAHSQDGVVDADCQSHDLKNLYIASCSVFPTGGVANPTLTIIALALRLADHLRRLPAE